jgi:hypothetical protein
MLEAGVAADGCEVVGQLDRAVVPFLQADDREVRRLAEDDFDVLGDPGVARVLQDDDAPAERLGLDDGVGAVEAELRGTDGN